MGHYKGQNQQSGHRVFVAWYLLVSVSDFNTLVTCYIDDHNGLGSTWLETAMAGFLMKSCISCTALYKKYLQFCKHKFRMHRVLIKRYSEYQMSLIRPAN